MTENHWCYCMHADKIIYADGCKAHAVHHTPSLNTMTVQIYQPSRLAVLTEQINVGKHCTGTVVGV